MSRDTTAAVLTGLGVAAATVGAALLAIPAGFLTFGALCLALGVMLAMSEPPLPEAIVVEEGEAVPELPEPVPGVFTQPIEMPVEPPVPPTTLRARAGGGRS